MPPPRGVGTRCELLWLGWSSKYLVNTGNKSSVNLRLARKPTKNIDSVVKSNFYELLFKGKLLGWESVNLYDRVNPERFEDILFNAANVFGEKKRNGIESKMKKLLGTLTKRHLFAESVWGSESCNLSIIVL